MLIVGLHERIPALVEPSLSEMLDSDSLVDKQAVIRSFMDEHESVPPIALSVFSYLLQCHLINDTLYHRADTSVLK